MSKATELGPPPDGDQKVMGPIRFFSFDPDGAELSRMIDLEGLCVHNSDDYRRYSIEDGH